MKWLFDRMVRSCGFLAVATSWIYGVFHPDMNISISAE
jgi:hypothetical protein